MPKWIHFCWRLCLLLVTGFIARTASQPFNFTAAWRSIGYSAPDDLSLAQVTTANYFQTVGFKLESITFLKKQINDATCTNPEPPMWDGFYILQGDEQATANLLELPYSYNTLALGLEATLKAAGINVYTVSGLYLTTDSELIGDYVTGYHIWVQVVGAGFSGNLACYLPDFQQGVRWPVALLGHNVTSISKSQPQGSQDVLGGGLQTLDVELWIQTADPKVTIDNLLAFFNGSVAKIAPPNTELQMNGLSVQSFVVYNITQLKGLDPGNVVRFYGNPIFGIPSVFPNRSSVTPKLVEGVSAGVRIGIILACVGFVCIVSVVTAMMWGARIRWSNSKPPKKAPPGQGHFPTLNVEDIEICRNPETGSDWLLGAGSYGNVYKGRCRGVQDVAVKIFHPHLRSCFEDYVQHEVNIMRRAKFDSHIVQFYGVAWDSERESGRGPMIIMELMEAGSLTTLIANDRDKEYTWYQKGRGVILDIAKGLAFLHATQVVHRDLKTSNILVSMDGVAKIGDPGLAKIMDASFMSLSESLAGTFNYAAPELLLGGRCSEKVDIYSFGVIIWEVITQEVVQRGNLHDLQMPEQCPVAVDELIDACLHSDPASRPSAAEIVERLLAIE